MTIYKKLSLARMKFHSLKLSKSGKNKFSGYSYFELSDFIVDGLKIFDEVGLCPIISFDKEFARMKIFDSDQDLTNPIEINSPLGSASLKGCHEVQNIGAVQTYQRRYLWMLVLEIIEHDALDVQPKISDDQSKIKVIKYYENPENDESKWKSANTVKDLLDLSKKLGKEVNISEWLDKAGVKSIYDMDENKLSKCTDYLKRLVGKV